LLVFIQECWPFFTQIYFMSYLQSQGEKSTEQVNDLPADEHSGGENEKLYDLGILYEMDDDEYVVQLLTILLRDSPKDFAEMEAAVLQQRISKVHSNAHKLKSTMGIIQANKLYALLEQIEDASRQGILTKSLTVYVEQALVEYDKISLALQSLLKDLK
jgi:HPt (histidine-containing phosphotransfer) domain-containing protein